MILTSVLVLFPISASRVDTVTIKPGGRSISPVFQKVPYMQGAKPYTVYLNGKPSTICIPENYKVNIVGKTKSGRVYGNFSAYFSGAYSGVNSFAFHTLNGKVELIQHKRIGSGSPVAFREPDMLIGIETDAYPGYELDDLRIRSWAWLYQSGKIQSLGPADDVWFLPSGFIGGYNLCDKSGNAGMKYWADWVAYYRPFKWKNGRRTEEPITKVKPKPTR